MTTRRTFLKSASLVAAAPALSACLPRTRRSAPTSRRGLTERCCSTDRARSVAWGAELRKEFRELDCLVHQLLMDPAPPPEARADVRRRFLRLHQRLATYPYSRPVAEAWLAFYRLTVRLDGLRNQEARGQGIPVYSFNGHQHAARMWMRAAALRGGSLPLLHVDTHADMRAVLQPSKVVQAVKRLSGSRRDRARGMKALVRLVNDHATPVTAGVLGDAVGDVVWAAPSWSYAPTFLQRPVLWASVPTAPRGDRIFQLLHDRGADRAGALPSFGARPWDEVEGIPSRARGSMKHVRERRLSFVRTWPPRDPAIAELTKVLPAGRFVLDIDLDYFMSIDSQSGFSRKGREALARGAWDREYGCRLRAGRRLLDQRLQDLRRLLAALRDRHRIPALITLADSTYMPFFPTLAGQAYWEYLPREFAGYVHWRVRHLLSEVYRRHGVAAGV